jgi:serine/threonine protein kinase
MPAHPRCPDRREFEALLSDQVAGAAVERLQAHLRDCPACAAAFKTLAETFATRPVRPAAVSLSAATVGSGPLSSDCSFLKPAQDNDELGRLGPFRVLRVLGRGGMGIVFLAEDTALHRLVALKVLQPRLHSESGAESRFLREARTLAGLRHEHLVTVYQLGHEGDAVYYAMELQQGETLDDWLRRTPAPPVDEIVRLGREIASGLAYIHQQGLVHRDIKPANIWLEAARRVKILDLGLARPVQDDLNLTAAGTILGTPGYMSPEQARGKALDGRSDLFSLGCVLYRMCTGQAPFQGDSMMAVLTSLAVDVPTPVHVMAAHIPPALSDLVAELLAKRVEDRPHSAAAVIERLAALAAANGAAWRSDTDVSSRPTGKRGAAHVTQEMKRPTTRWWQGAALVAVLALAALGLWALASTVRRREPLQPAAPAPPAAAVYLANLKDIERQHWPFVMPKDDPNDPRKGDKEKKKKGFDDKGKKGDKGDKKGPDFEHPLDGREHDKNAVRIQGRIYAHGIFMHPPPRPVGDPAGLSYRLDKKFRLFVTQVSLNDGPERSESPCTFWVYGDGKLLWQSRPVSSQDDTQECAIPVSAVDVLKIAVSCPGPPYGAHAVWLDPHVMP